MANILARPTKRLALTQDELAPGDRIKFGGEYFQVYDKTPIFIGKKLVYYQVTLELLPQFGTESGVWSDDVVEGNYSTWTYQWKKQPTVDWSAAFSGSLIELNEATNRLLVFDSGNTKRVICVLTTGVIIGSVQALKSGGGASYDTPMSLTGKYFVEMVDTGSTHNLKIYTDTALIQTIDWNVITGEAYVPGYFLCAFSLDGKYLLVSASDCASLFRGA